MRENRPSGSEGGEAETNRPSLPLSKRAYACLRRRDRPELGKTGSDPVESIVWPACACRSITDNWAAR